MQFRQAISLINNDMCKLLLIDLTILSSSYSLINFAFLGFTPAFGSVSQYMLPFSFCLYQQYRTNRSQHCSLQTQTLTRAICVDSSEKLFNRLVNNDSTANLLPFETLAEIAYDSKGQLIRPKVKAMIKLFRPDRNGYITKIDFLNTIDGYVILL